MTHTEEKIFCKCGCGEQTSIAKVTNKRWGHTAGSPFRYLRGHNRKSKQIEDYIIPEPNSGCHLWIGGLSQGGYGKKKHFGRNWYAHRLIYELEHGEIPNGLMLDHLCRIRSCVNSKHMEVVTNKENILRGIGPAALHARKKNCPKCSGPYTKDTKGNRICVNCKRTYNRNRYAINRQFLRVENLPSPAASVVYAEPSGQLAMVLK